MTKQLLLSYISLHKAITRNTVARWTISLFNLAGIDTCNRVLLAFSLCGKEIWSSYQSYHETNQSGGVVSPLHDSTTKNLTGTLQAWHKGFGRVESNKMTYFYHNKEGSIFVLGWRSTLLIKIVYQLYAWGSLIVLLGKLFLIIFIFLNSLLSSCHGFRNTWERSGKVSNSQVVYHMCILLIGMRRCKINILTYGYSWGGRFPALANKGSKFNQPLKGTWHIS